MPPLARMRRSSSTSTTWNRSQTALSSRICRAPICPLVRKKVSESNLSKWEYSVTIWKVERSRSKVRRKTKAALVPKRMKSWVMIRRMMNRLLAQRVTIRPRAILSSKRHASCSNLRGVGNYRLEEQRTKDWSNATIFRRRRYQSVSTHSLSVCGCPTRISCHRRCISRTLINLRTCTPSLGSYSSRSIRSSTRAL